MMPLPHPTISADEMIDTATELRTRINHLIAQGTEPEELAQTHHDWLAVQRDVEMLCAQMTLAAPDVAHSVLDDVRDMIKALDDIPMIQLPSEEMRVF